MSVARLSLGTAQLGLAYGIAGRRELMTPAQADEILDAAFESGVSSLDTAAAYGCAEQRIGDYFARRGGCGEVVVSSKLGALGAVPAAEIGDRVRGELRASLDRLRIERIDAYLVHDFADLRAHGSALLDALQRELEAGRIARIGVSIYSPTELDDVARFPSISLVQHPSSLFDRRFKREATQIAVHARSVLLQGLLTLTPERVPEALAAARDPLRACDRLAREWGMTRRALALAYVAAVPGIERIVVGVDSADQLRRNVESLSTPFPAERMRLLEQAVGELPSDVIDPRGWPEFRT